MTLCEGWAEGWQDGACSQTFWGSCIMLFVFKAQVGQAEEHGGKMEVMAGATPPESQAASSSPSFSFFKTAKFVNVPCFLWQRRTNVSPGCYFSSCSFRCLFPPLTVVESDALTCNLVKAGLEKKKTVLTQS